MRHNDSLSVFTEGCNYCSTMMVTNCVPAPGGQTASGQSWSWGLWQLCASRAAGWWAPAWSAAARPHLPGGHPRLDSSPMISNHALRDVHILFCAWVESRWISGACLVSGCSATHIQACHSRKSILILYPGSRPSVYGTGTKEAELSMYQK